ncbi:MAG: hypothetical protein ACI9BD_000489 [Candidatus Marinamargulisbacteria bacterium]|jgi:hypothetical protein
MLKKRTSMPTKQFQTLSLGLTPFEAAMQISEGPLSADLATAIASDSLGFCNASNRNRIFYTKGNKTISYAETSDAVLTVSRDWMDKDFFIDDIIDALFEEEILDDKVLSNHDIDAEFLTNTPDIATEIRTRLEAQIVGQRENQLKAIASDAVAYVAGSIVIGQTNLEFTEVAPLALGSAGDTLEKIDALPNLGPKGTGAAKGHLLREAALTALQFHIDGCVIEQDGWNAGNLLVLPNGEVKVIDLDYSDDVWTTDRDAEDVIDDCLQIIHPFLTQIVDASVANDETYQSLKTKCEALDYSAMETTAFLKAFHGLNDDMFARRSALTPDFESLFSVALKSDVPSETLQKGMTDMLGADGLTKYTFSELLLSGC